MIGLSESVVQEIMAEGYDGVKGTLICPSLIDTGLFKGARVKLLEALKPEYVADVIMTGIRANEVVIAIPSWTCYIVLH